MNKIKTTVFAIASLLTVSAYAQNVGINATGGLPSNSAGLDVDFTNKGVLIPRVALTGSNDVATIAAPTTSLLVYNTATANTYPNEVKPGYYYWNGTKWVRFATDLLNANQTTSIGKFYVNGINLAPGSLTTFAIADANCVTASQISVSWAGLLPGTNLEDYNIQIENVQTSNGTWYVQIVNFNSFWYNGLSLAFVAFY